MWHAPPKVVTLSRRAVRALDRAATDELGIPGLLLMENAAAAIEERALLMGPDPDDAFLIVCGPGNNGGDGLALARRLAVRGLIVAVALAADPARLRGDALANLDMARRLNIPAADAWLDAPAGLSRAQELARSQRRGHHKTGRLIIADALFGTGLDRPIDGETARAVEWINAARARGAAVLAADIPSGLDCDTGRPLGPAAVRADVTVTLAAMKPGLLDPASRAFTGEVVVAGIGVPAWLLDRCAAADAPTTASPSPGSPASNARSSTA
ncbi:MAG: NAD(P)H-hydrate epimerase [Phycisphaerales bacterium]|nr:NAD(P)H-hydrate epimerase [Phycisphaerales bacterium]